MRWNSIRFRITALATAVVAVVLVVAGLSLVLVQRAVLTDSLDTALIQRAEDIVGLLESSPAPDELSQGATEAFAQLVGEDGNVVVSTPNLANDPPLPIPVDPQEGTTIQTLEGLEVDDDHFRVLSRVISGVGVLHVGTTYDVVTESTAVLTSSLAVVVPIVVAMLAILVWWLVGRTLRPVEAIRTEVASIGSTDLHRRVPGSGSGDEIDRLAGTMNAMLERVETSVTRQQRFVADASHELRNPLTRIRAALELERRDAGDPKVIDDLLEEVVDLQHMVEDMLYMARADAGANKPVLRRVDLDDVLLREARSVHSRVDVAMDMSRVSAAQVYGDPSQLGRAIRNLVTNAERHARSRVQVSLFEDDGSAVLVIADDGPGVPSEQAQFVFERFTRLDEARSADAGGTGLGLAIAREIAEVHAGTLNLISNGSPGATFEMRIPLAD